MNDGYSWESGPLALDPPPSAGRRTGASSRSRSSLSTSGAIRNEMNCETDTPLRSASRLRARFQAGFGTMYVTLRSPGAVIADRRYTPGCTLSRLHRLVSATSNVEGWSDRQRLWPPTPEMAKSPHGKAERGDPDCGGRGKGGAEHFGQGVARVGVP